MPRDPQRFPEAEIPRDKDPWRSPEIFRDLQRLDSQESPKDPPWFQIEPILNVVHSLERGGRQKNNRSPLPPYLHTHIYIYICINMVFLLGSSLLQSFNFLRWFLTSPYEWSGDPCRPCFSFVSDGSSDIPRHTWRFLLEIAKIPAKFWRFARIPEMVTPGDPKRFP